MRLVVWVVDGMLCGMASWCANCSGKTVSFDRSRGVDVTAVFDLGRAAHENEVRPGTHPDALTRWVSDDDLWVAAMGSQSQNDYPDGAIDVIRDFFDAAWAIPLPDSRPQRS